jgi:hypothetical protein
MFLLDFLMWFSISGPTLAPLATATEIHSKHVQGKISTSLTPPTFFSKMSKDDAYGDKTHGLWAR